MIKMKINGNEYMVEEDITVMEACRNIGIEIPTLCHDERLEAHAACRLCVVEVEGKSTLMTSCSLKVYEELNVQTHSERVIKARHDILDLLYSNHTKDCLGCDKSGECKLQDYCYEYGVENGSYVGEKRALKVDMTNPFYYYNPNKCILCGKCVNVCKQLQCTSAIEMNERGFATHVGTPFEAGINKSTCVSCGNCVSVCPVGALMPKASKQLPKARVWETERTRTTCSYCGVGCQLELITRNGKVIGAQPLNVSPNRGLLCVKGKFGYKFINSPDRLTTPLVRKNGKLEEASWEEAYSLIASKILELKAEHGPDSIAGFSSARCTNEDNYMFQKFIRAVVGTNNIDHCARLCHASTVAGLATTLGSGAMTNSVEEVLDTDAMFLIGSNPTENHPVIGAYMKQALKKGAKLIVADPRRIEMADHADVYLQIKPGTNIALLNAMMHVIIEKGLQDEEYIKARTVDYDNLVELVRKYTPEYAAEICGVDAEDIVKAATIYAEAEKAGIFYAMGITQHTMGTRNVMSISNLAMLCGNIGKPASGINALRGQNNVQGSCDMGALPGDLPGYQKVTNPKVIEKFEKAWEVELSKDAGLTLSEILDAAGGGKVKMLYVLGENPMVSDPDINHVKHSLESLELLVVQDMFLTETAELADVVLPAASFAEKDGTFTNTGRTVQRVRKAVEPVGGCKPDWVILMEIMNRLGYKKTYSHPSQIMDEIASVTPSYAGIGYDRIEEEGIQWPCPTRSHPGTPYMHKDTFARGKGLFSPAVHSDSAELPDAEYPYILTTGRVLYHYHTRTMTGRVDGLNQKSPESFIEMSESAARELGVQDGETVRVKSRRGEIETKVKITPIISKNVVFMPFHFAKGAANMLTNTAKDDICKIPELKVAAVRIEKIV